ncbi:hypothetical protein [Qaidamihabitans albus]|uniref:hypothetical protein n=1 Tax=Qaidamihabitans albus TaxID=2795733 RepID=UPI0018F13CD5|nr:hypothetical protein [Qaidamihabitans albus]
MSWNDYYQRRDIIEAVLRQARRAPGAPLPFAEVEGAERAFGTEENLLRALHYKWTQVLGGYLRAEVAGPEDADDVPGGGESDHVDAVARAWHGAVRDHPTLHAVLEAHLPHHPALRPMHDAELRMLAVTAGLAEPNEPRDEVTRIGEAFEALLRNQTARHAPDRRANPVGQLLRRLAPTG